MNEEVRKRAGWKGSCRVVCTKEYCDGLHRRGENMEDISFHN